MAISLTQIHMKNNFAQGNDGANDYIALDLTKITAVKARPGSRTEFFLYMGDGNIFRIVDDIDTIEALLSITLSTTYKNWVKANIASVTDPGDNQK